jgi:hypothetical protein
MAAALCDCYTGLRSAYQYHELGDQWTARGDVLRCVVVNDSPEGMDDVFISVDNRDFTVAEFTRLVGSFAG